MITRCFLPHRKVLLPPGLLTMFVTRASLGTLYRSGLAGGRTRRKGEGGVTPRAPTLVHDLLSPSERPFWTSFSICPRAISAGSLSVRSGLLSFSAGHRSFWPRGRFGGQNPRNPAYGQVHSFAEIARCVSGISGFLTQNRGVGPKITMAGAEKE